MKNLIILILCLFSISLFSQEEEDLKYNNRIIYQDKLDALFKQFQKLLLTDGKKVYDLRQGNKNKLETKDANAPRPFSLKQDGRAEGVIYKIENHESFLLKIGSKVIYVTGNVDTSKLTEISKYSANLGHIGTFKYKKANGKVYSLPKVTVLKPVTKEIFKEYIKDKKLYNYKKIKKRVPARKKMCTKCKGDGKWGHKNRRCGVCKETGTVVARWKEQIIWEKEEIK